MFQGPLFIAGHCVVMNCTRTCSWTYQGWQFGDTKEWHSLAPVPWSGLIEHCIPLMLRHRRGGGHREGMTEERLGVTDATDRFALCRRPTTTVAYCAVAAHWFLTDLRSEATILPLVHCPLSVCQCGFVNSGAVYQMRQSQQALSNVCLGRCPFQPTRWGTADGHGMVSLRFQLILPDLDAKLLDQVIHA